MGGFSANAMRKHCLRKSRRGYWNQARLKKWVCPASLTALDQICSPNFRI
ncbi:hypothetical protein YC2023_051834 [Brassica napus]